MKKTLQTEPNRRFPSTIEGLVQEADRIFQESEKIRRQALEQSLPLDARLRELQQKIKDEEDKAVLNHIEVLLTFAPEHQGMPKCDDESLSRCGECTRCTLLYLRKNEWEIENFRFNFQVVREYVKGEQ